jgi:acyl-CoA thioesterase-1
MHRYDLRPPLTAALGAILLVLMLGGCSQPLPILAFGDSLTHGNGVSLAQSYPAVLQQLTGHQVINEGVPGEVTADGLRRLPAVLEKHEPALVVLCHGGNDLLRHEDTAATAENLRQMIRTIRAHGAAVVLVAVPKPGLLLRPAELYTTVAEELKVPIDRTTLPELEADRTMKSDSIHLNQAGYRALAQAVDKLLRQAGAL